MGEGAVIVATRVASVPECRWLIWLALHGHEDAAVKLAWSDLTERRYEALTHYAGAVN